MSADGGAAEREGECDPTLAIPYVTLNLATVTNMQATFDLD